MGLIIRILSMAGTFISMKWVGPMVIRSFLGVAKFSASNTTKLSGLIKEFGLRTILTNPKLAVGSAAEITTIIAVLGAIKDSWDETKLPEVLIELRSSFSNKNMMTKEAQLDAIDNVTAFINSIAAGSKTDPEGLEMAAHALTAVYMPNISTVRDLNLYLYLLVLSTVSIVGAYQSAGVRLIEVTLKDNFSSWPDAANELIDLGAAVASQTGNLVLSAERTAEQLEEE